MFVIFDLDGTLALNEHREHFLQKSPQDWDGFFEACDKDEPNLPIINLLKYLSEHYEVRLEIWSGRSEKVRHKTKDWLDRYGVFSETHYSLLRMRGSSDFRSDTVLKNEWLDNESSMPDVVFDDRNSVVEFWRGKGIACCQVAEGDF